MIQDLFFITDFLDSARWDNASNYNLINYYNDDLSNDTKLLTHWLCYITDRQTPFKRIWDIGGFVFSELVETVTISSDINLLNPDKSDSFFIKKENDKYTFRSHSIAGKNRRLSKYELDEAEKVDFISRFYPSDFVLILNTFYILKQYDFSLTKYILSIIQEYFENNDLIRRILFSLFLLTYKDAGQYNSLQLGNFKKLSDVAKKRTTKIKEILKNKSIYNNEFGFFIKKDIYSQKRAWCSFRDYIKSPEFKKYFKESLSNFGFNNFDLLTSFNALSQLELPGDVWNNKPKFRECLFSRSKYSDRKESFPRLLRQIFEKEKIKTGYPEQFDITFDFIPRMCESTFYNCDICPYGVIAKNKNNIFKLCHADENKLCTVALFTCNYKISCKGNDCQLLELIKKYET